MKSKFIYHGFRLSVGLLLLAGASFPVAAQTISTVAGDGTTAATGSGTGGSNSVAVDTAGNIYVSTGGLNTIRKITPANVVTTFAGTGTAGYSGDNAAATAATFRNIQDLYIAAGNLYVADAGNRRIRKINLTTNVVTTAAGDGTATVTGNGIGGTSAVAVDTAGNIYVAGGGLPVIRKITPANVYSTFAGTGATGYSGDDSAATAATFNLPSDLFISNNNLYIADTRNRRIRSINLTTNVISTVAGDGTSNITGNGIGAATGIAVDGAGIIFVATGAGGNAIRRISGSTYTTLSGGSATGGFSGDNGTPSTAVLHLPTDLYINGTDLFVSDQRNRRVRKITNTTVPLPLDLIRFTAIPGHSDVALSWITTMEKNTDGFDVERSADAHRFDMIGSVKSHGNNTREQVSYGFNDPAPLDGKSFYRLKLRDRDGAFTYSNVVMMHRTTEGGLLLSPVPATHMLTLSLHNTTLIGTAAVITDMQGKSIQHLSLAASMQLDLSSWTSGIYFLRLQNGYTIRFVKQ